MAKTFSGLKPMSDGQELPGGAERVNDGHTSAYLLPLGEKELALIDCGNDVEAKTIKAELQKRRLLAFNADDRQRNRGQASRMAGLGFRVLR